MYSAGRTTLPFDLDIFAPSISHQPWLTMLARQRQTGRQQERRPVDGVLTDDLLADQMHVGRPVLARTARRRRIVRAVADRGHVVGQRVEPDVHHVRRIVGNRNAPLERRAADAQILEAVLEKRHHLVAATRRRHEIRMLPVVVEQRLLERGQPEEVALLGDPFDRCCRRSDSVPSTSCVSGTKTSSTVQYQPSYLSL